MRISSAEAVGAKPKTTKVSAVIIVTPLMISLPPKAMLNTR
jgi:hypothetical protein